MLALRRLAGVSSQVNLRNPMHEGYTYTVSAEFQNRAIHDLKKD